MSEGIQIKIKESRTYAVERSKPCSSAIHRRTTHPLVPDESGNYNSGSTKGVCRERRSAFPTFVKRPLFFIKVTTRAIITQVVTYSKNVSTIAN